MLADLSIGALVISLIFWLVSGWLVFWLIILLVEPVTVLGWLVAMMQGLICEN